MTTRSQSLFNVLSKEHTDIIHVFLEASTGRIPFALSGISSMNELPRFFPPATEKKKERKRKFSLLLTEAASSIK